MTHRHHGLHVKVLVSLICGGKRCRIYRVQRDGHWRQEYELDGEEVSVDKYLRHMMSCNPDNYQKCRRCGEELKAGDNTTKARLENQDYICKFCAKL